MKFKFIGALLFLLGMGVLLPFVMMPGLTDPSSSLQLAALCLLCILLTLFSWKDIRDIFGNLPLLPLISLGGFLIWSAVSLIGAISPAESIFNLMRSGALFCLFPFALAFFRQNDKSLVTFSRVLSATAAVLCLIGLFQILIADNTWVNLPPTATQGNRNFYAEALFMLLPFVLLSVCSTRGAERWAHTCILALLLLLCVLARTRSVWAALAVTLLAGIVLLALFAPQNLPGRFSFLLKRKWLLPAAALILMAGMGAAWKYRNTAGLHLLTQKEIPLISGTMGSSAERLILWRHTVNEIAAHPLKGVGAGQWKLIIGRDGVRGFYEGYATRYYTSAHNDYLQVAAETGLPGLLLWLMLPLAALAAGIATMRRAARANQGVSPVLRAAILTSGLCGWAVISLLGFPGERVLTASLFICLCAALMAPASGKKIRLPRFPVTVLVILMAGAGLVYAMFRIRSEQHVIKMLEAKAYGRWNLVLREGRLAESPLFRYDFVSATPISWYTGIARFSQQDYARAAGEMKVAYSLSPYHPQVLNAAGSASGMAGDLAAAEEYYSASLKCFPDFEEAATNLADVLIFQQKYDAAADMLKNKYTGERSERIQALLDKAESQGKESPVPGIQPP